MTAREQHLEFFDPLRNDAGIALLEFALGVQLIGRLLLVTHQADRSDDPGLCALQPIGQNCTVTTPIEV